MATNAGEGEGDQRRLLQKEDSISGLSAAAIASPKSTKSPNPSSSPILRHGYHRMDSSPDLDDAISRSSPKPSINPFFENDEPQLRGLGISDRRTSIPRVPVGSRTSMHSPTPSNPFVSPLDSPRITEPSYVYNGDGLARDTPRIEEEQDVTKGRNSQFTEEFNTEEDGGNKGMDNNHSHNNHLDCPSTEQFYSKRASWLSISILGLSLYSTIFSGIWLVLAIAQPRYGRFIRSGGNFPPSTASTVFALFAKMIELSFVTVFVTFLGQVLSRRSLAKSSRGMTIAEMTMRTWVIQPGFMITHGQHLYHVGISLLGAITLVAAFIAMFYTTASDALVSPHLKFGGWEHKLMYGSVQSSYANPNFIKANCQTPITAIMDPVEGGNECIALDYAGQAYHNSIAYMSTWAGIRAAGGTSTKLAKRPQAPGMLYDNTTVTGRWILINTSDINAAHEKYNRVINNVSLAMPHAGILAAALDPKNSIIQPEDLAGVGQYSMRASVISPAVNVIIRRVGTRENQFKHYTSAKVSMVWLGIRTSSLPGQNYTNTTVVDDLFEWGEKYGRQTPIFPMLPIDYNTITNISAANYSDSIYLLAKSPNITDYTLCQLRSFVSPSCSTYYNVSGTTGGHIEARCEDEHDDMAYSKSVPDAPTVRSSDWRNVAAQWMLATSMDSGTTNANASISRLLSQLIVPASSGLNNSLPSLAEHLSVMVGSTLLSSTTLSSYYHYWDHTDPELTEPEYRPFNASIVSQQYTSGFTSKWEGIFYIVLLLVFATNAFCLVYLFMRSGLVTDYTEPQNLFALAVNSPPSHAVAGSCGAGPKGEQLNVNWHVDRADKSGHFFFKNAGQGNGNVPQDFELRRRPSGISRSLTSYSRLSKKRSSFL
ncbi:hypothetical protein LSUB1_G003795 [Lachnellula subtilissima]|uniref:Mcm2 3 5 family protein n=1 Tax=Lachnellula subtilissima TaxID=602034 RepID=A0A8H8RX73_9HELO|nr:hypothetical protein LSUB1_G003795 [Lachnellula subtilissima]